MAVAFYILGGCMLFAASVMTFARYWRGRHSPAGRRRRLIRMANAADCRADALILSAPTMGYSSERTDARREAAELRAVAAHARQLASEVQDLPGGLSEVDA